MTRRLFIAHFIILLSACIPQVRVEAQTKKPPATQSASSPRHHTIVLKTPARHPYLLIGGSTGMWFGSGERFALNDNGELGEYLGASSTRATSIGPLGIGVLQIIRPRIAFDARIGIGAVHFNDDALINADLDASSGSHTGFLFSGELRMRYLHEEGFTAALGASLNSVNLVESDGGTFNLSTRLGYMFWDKDYTSFWLIETGYAYPVVNGLIPEFREVRRDSPITSSWHILEMAIYFGF